MDLDEEEIGGGFDIIDEEEVGSLTAESNKPTPKSKGRKVTADHRAAMLLQDGVLPSSDSDSPRAVEPSTRRTPGGKRERTSDARKAEQKAGAGGRGAASAMQDVWRFLDRRSQEVTVCLVRTGDSVSVTLMAAPSTGFPGDPQPVERSNEKVRRGVSVVLGGTLGALFGGAPGSAIGAALGGYLSQKDEKPTEKAGKTQKLLQSKEQVEEVSGKDDDHARNAKRLRPSSERSPVYVTGQDEDDDSDAATRLYPVRAGRCTSRGFEPPEELPPPPQPD